MTRAARGRRSSMEGTVVWRRVTGAALAAALLGGVSACGSTEQFDTQPQTSASTATTSASTIAAEKNAVAQLQAWLADPVAGTLTYNAVEVTSGGAINVMTILSGGFDPGSGQSTLAGSIETLGSGSTTQGQSSAVEFGGKVYTSIPTALQTGERAGKLWEASPVHTIWGTAATHSGWWTALDSVKAVDTDGVVSLAGTTVDMFSVIVDLSTVKGVPKALLGSDPIKKAGTTKVEVDLYTTLGSGSLVRVTYKFGLPVEIDAAATSKSTAGYQVDMSGFDNSTASASPSPSPTGSATAQPDSASTAEGSGNADLAALLPF
jgi:hypothetical protein